MLSRMRPSSQSYQVAALCGVPFGLTVATTAGFASARNASISGGTGARGIGASLPGRLLLGPALQPGVRLPERHRLSIGFRVVVRVGQLGERVGDELLLARAALDRVGPVLEREAELREVAA